jgi:fructoselysine-6-P-deglycase FrlB-like protein
MTATILSIIAALLPVLLEWIGKPKGTADVEERIQRARKALAEDDGDSFDALAAAQRDRLRLALPGHLQGRINRD